MNAPRHPTPSKRAAQPPSKRSGHLGKSTPGLQATGWWAGTRRQSLTSRTRTSQASTCDASEAAGLTSEDRRSTTTAPTSRGCRSRSTAAVLRGRQPPRGVGQFKLGSASFDTARQRRVWLRAASSLCPRPIGKRVLPGRPLLPCLCLLHTGPQGIAKRGITKTTLTSPLRMTRSRVGKSTFQSPKGKSPRGTKTSHV